jgi:hypothetical protein
MLLPECGRDDERNRQLPIAFMVKAPASAGDGVRCDPTERRPHRSRTEIRSAAARRWLIEVDSRSHWSLAFHHRT